MRLFALLNLDTDAEDGSIRNRDCETRISPRFLPGQNASRAMHDDEVGVGSTLRSVASPVIGSVFERFAGANQERAC